MQMQLDRDLPVVESDPTSRIDKLLNGARDASDLNDAFRSLDSLSWAESLVSPGSWSMLEVCASRVISSLSITLLSIQINEVDRHAPSGDDELGIHMLLKPDIHDLFPILPGYDACGAMAEGIVDLAGKVIRSTDRDIQTDRLVILSTCRDIDRS
jgi:hypothetical protein